MSSNCPYFLANYIKKCDFFFEKALDKISFYAYNEHQNSMYISFMCTREMTAVFMPSEILGTQDL